MAERESCRMCGGDGRVGNAFGGSSTSCPSCNGTGRRVASDTVFHDVTKTKPSHHRPAVKPGAPPESTWQPTAVGAQLVGEVNASGLSDDVKKKIVLEIMEYEGSHGKCTQTFLKKVRKRIK